jgi:LemA protein
LQEELTATEGRIAYARQFFNDSVLKYNNKIQAFPTVIYARMLKFTEREYFEADEADRAAPRVSFDQAPRADFNAPTPPPPPPPAQ